MTPAQTQIVEMLCDGVAPKEIMYQLGMTRDLITKQIGRARRSLGCKTTCQLVATFAVARAAAKEQLRSQAT